MTVYFDSFKSKYILKILWKRGEIAPQEQFLLFSTIFYNLISDFCVIIGARFFLRDKRLFERTEVEITRVDCMNGPYFFTIDYGKYSGKKSQLSVQENIICMTWCIN